MKSVKLPSLQLWAKSFSTSLPRFGYGDTVENLKIGKNTRVIFQGFTGRQATFNAKESIKYGTHIVGGVTPGKTAEHLGLPVLPSVTEAVKQLQPDATGIYVAAEKAAGAIEEAIEAEVPLVVAVAEHIPVHQMLRIHQILKTQSKSRLVGANSPGIISAIGRCRIGFQPLSCFLPGHIGIVAKSGTLSYEAVASTTRAGLGQSLCIGMGGDLLAGTNFLDALKIFEKDEETHGIILIGELGGATELEAAAWILDYNRRATNPKPIAALIAGFQVSSRTDTSTRAMGHAGAFTTSTCPTVREKISHLEKAGVTIVNHPARFGGVIKRLLETRRMSGHMTGGTHVQQRSMCSYHGYSRRCVGSGTFGWPLRLQKRHLHIRGDHGLQFLGNEGLKSTVVKKRLTLSIDGASRSPVIILQNSPEQKATTYLLKQYGITEEDSKSLVRLLSTNKNAVESLHITLISLWNIFEAHNLLSLEVTLIDVDDKWIIADTRISFDDAKLRIDPDINLDKYVRAEEYESLTAEAAKHGIVYVKLSGQGNIGTLVNGAGLAMNTIDALADAGGHATNFLDTGGKATSETVKKSFEIILQDPRVKVVFVNIFGGLTLGDMIADGILLAFKELQVDVPVVVRIRGTNEKEGQKVIADSGLPLFAFDDFDDAAAKAIELANADTQ